MIHHFQKQSSIGEDFFERNEAMSEIFSKICSGRKKMFVRISSSWQNIFQKYPGGDWFQQWLPSPPAIRKWQTKDRLPWEGIWHPRISTDLWWTEDVTSGYKPWEEWVCTEQGNQPWRRSTQVAMQCDFESHHQMTCHKIVSHHQMTCHSLTGHLFTCHIMF